MQSNEKSGFLKSSSLTLKHGFFGRNHSPALIAEVLDVPLKEMFFLKQTHGNSVITAGENTYLSEADGVVSTSKKWLLMIKTADCLPILLQSEDESVKAAIHASWRTTLSGIIEKTVEKMEELGAKDIKAAFGPCIQKQNYEFKQDMKSRFPIHIQEDQAVFEPIPGKEAWLFDVPLLAAQKLGRFGITPDTSCMKDTYTDENYFSVRRTSHTEGQPEPGRNWSVI